MNDFEPLRVAIHSKLACPDVHVGLDKIIDISLGLVQHLKETNFPLPVGQPYSRTVLYRSSEIELMIARWAYASECAPHDHGHAESLIYILSGSVRHRLYKIMDGRLQVIREEHKAQGDCIRCAPFQIHSMAPQEPLLTLHVYAPIIEDMYVYSAKEKLTFRVRGNCGAWIPLDDSRDIFETFLAHQPRVQEV